MAKIISESASSIINNQRRLTRGVASISEAKWHHRNGGIGGVMSNVSAAAGEAIGGVSAQAWHQ